MTEPPPIRTFHARHGRMRAGAWRTLEEVGPRFAPERRTTDRPVVLEIGCGFGDAALAFADHHPHLDVVAVDVHRPGIVHLLRTLEAEPRLNVWVARADALTMLMDTTEPPPAGLGPLAGVHAFFPDPWPKARHHKRRLVRPDVVDLLARRLAPGAPLRVATDAADYAAAARRVLDDHPAFEGGPTRRPGWRPAVGYEARAAAAGRAVSDLLYVRRYGAT